MNKGKLETLISQRPSQWSEKAVLREENATWLDLSFTIALKILRTLRKKGMTQKELAEKMNVSAQYINKVLKGSENLSLETISKLGQVLEIDLVSINPTIEKILLSNSRIKYMSYNATVPEIDNIEPIWRFGSPLIDLNSETYQPSKSEFCEQQAA